MISVVCFKWSKPGYRSTFTAAHVNTLRNMVERHYQNPHRFICITDDPAGIERRVECVPLWNTYAELKNPTWPAEGPSCYRRLRVFCEDFGKIAGERFVCLDLDVVATADLRPLWNRTEDFVIYRSATGHYNASMFMMTTGCRAQVWHDFDPVLSPKEAKAGKNFGSDQGWIQHRLGRDEATWTSADGIYAFRRDCARLNRGRLPEGARLVVFHGKPDPWEMLSAPESPWIAEHYR